MNEQIRTILNSGAERFLAKLHPSGYQYAGLHPSGHRPGKPKNKIDEFAMYHDKDYDSLKKLGYDPYYRFSPADERLIKRIKDYLKTGKGSQEERMIGTVIVEFFELKKITVPPLLDMGLAQATRTGDYQAYGDQLIWVGDNEKQKFKPPKSVNYKGNPFKKKNPKSKPKDTRTYEPPANLGGWGDDDYEDKYDDEDNSFWGDENKGGKPKDLPSNKKKYKGVLKRRLNGKDMYGKRRKRRYGYKRKLAKVIKS